MKDICGTTGLACTRCNPGACEYRYYNAVQKHEYEINEKFVIMAITKQMPQRPYEESDGYCPDGNEVWDYYCPACNYDFDEDQPNYCPVCGQKIDWSPIVEEEDDGEDD